MVTRQVLIPSANVGAVADRLAALGHDLDILQWSPDGVSRLDGTTVEADELHPEAAWISLELFFAGQFSAFVDTVLGLDSVRWVQACLAGVDAPPFVKIQEAGIRLSNSDAPNDSVAEYVMSSMLAVVNGVAGRIDSHKDQKWRQRPWREISGMRWVIVGFGSIGRKVAERARPFGVEIVGVRRSAVEDDAADRMTTMDMLHHELAQADAVILAFPLSEKTKGLADAEFFAAMKKGSILVNVARGPVVDTPALLHALDAGIPATAILDVFDVEPLPDEDPLWSHPSVFFTSHIAGAGQGTGPRGETLFIEQLDNYLAGRPLRLEI